MADEITTTFSLSVAKGSLVEEYKPGTTRADLTSNLGAGGVQSIATSETALVTTNATAGGYFFARNLDATDFVEIGVTGTMIVKLLPGEWCCFRAGTAAIYATADSNPCDLQYRLYSP